MWDSETPYNYHGRFSDVSMLVSHVKFILLERNCHTQFFNFSHGEMPSSAQAKFVSSHHETAD